MTPSDQRNQFVAALLRCGKVVAS